MLVCFPANCRHTAHTSCPILRPPRLACLAHNLAHLSRLLPALPRPPAAKERGQRRTGGQGWAHLHAQARRGHHGACKAQGRQARAAGGGSRGGGSQEAAAGGRRRRRGGSSGRRRRQRVMHQEVLRLHARRSPACNSSCMLWAGGGLVYEACCTGDRSRCLGAVLHPGGTCQVPTAGEHAVHSGEERGLRAPQVLANILTNKVKREPVLHSPSKRPIPGGQEPGGGMGGPVSTRFEAAAARRGAFDRLKEACCVTAASTSSYGCRGEELCHTGRPRGAGEWGVPRRGPRVQVSSRGADWCGQAGPRSPARRG